MISVSTEKSSASTVRNKAVYIVNLNSKQKDAQYNRKADGKIFLRFELVAYAPVIKRFIFNCACSGKGVAIIA